MTIIKKILKSLLVVIILIIAGFIFLILYGIISDYKPPEIEVISGNEGTASSLSCGELNLLTWNIGYCGLDKDMDFFYDGGKKVFTPEEKCADNMSSILKFLDGNDSIDFFLLQEVDRESKRSYRTDQYKGITDKLDTYKGYFAVNYDVFFVPVPPTSPMGKVFSGISTFSRFKPALSVRYSFPGEYGFPKQLFMLDRCFLVNRYPLAGGKELVIINTHNEAFDPGDIRKAQMEYLRNFLLDEYKKGNFVIAGGDWNQCPPGFSPEFTENLVNNDQMVIPSDYLPGEWVWAYDRKTPSNRTVTAEYDPATTTTTVIDFFLLSPNIEGVTARCINLNFKNSDHNPVVVRVKLKSTIHPV
jgi:endonuclease/exonuclease/phosphatase family metal-dependent hydrolase